MPCYDYDLAILLFQFESWPGAQSPNSSSSTTVSVDEKEQVFFSQPLDIQPFCVHQKWSLFVAVGFRSEHQNQNPENVKKTMALTDVMSLLFLWSYNSSF